VDECGIARTTGELERLVQHRKLAILLHLTGVPLSGSLDILHAWYELGIRAIHPPFDAELSARPQAWQTGEKLSPFGRRVIEEMAQLGMMVDLAHASEPMAKDVLSITAGPLIVSHTMSTTLCPSKRNISDELATAIAARGGVIGIHFAGPLIDPEYEKSIAASGFREELRRWETDLRKQYPEPFAYLAARYDYGRWLQSKAYRLQQSVKPPPLGRLLDHIDHFVKLVGIDHVGIGSDYELGSIPAELDQADKLPNLTSALLQRGYSPADLNHLWGGNFLRVYRQVLKG
jgi:membrane dipeptidase